LTELAGKSARKIAAVLNERKIATPTGGVWHAATVIRGKSGFARHAKQLSRGGGDKNIVVRS
jgi:Recombinase